MPVLDLGRRKWLKRSVLASLRKDVLSMVALSKEPTADVLPARSAPDHRAGALTHSAQSCSSTLVGRRSAASPNLLSTLVAAFLDGQWQLCGHSKSAGVQSKRTKCINEICKTPAPHDAA